MNDSERDPQRDLGRDQYGESDEDIELRAMLREMGLDYPFLMKRQAE